MKVALTRVDVEWCGQPKRLLVRLEEELALRHYSPRTVEAYAGWVKRFILFHGRRHPKEMGREEVAAFLSNLAVEGEVVNRGPLGVRSPLDALGPSTLSGANPPPLAARARPPFADRR